MSRRPGSSRRRLGGAQRSRPVDLPAADHLEELGPLQTLSSALSAAAGVSDVVAALVEGAAAVVGAPVALGFVEDGEIVIAELGDLGLAPWQHLDLSEGRMLYRAAIEGRMQRATGRDELVATFPATAALAPEAESAISTPLRVEGRVIGAIGFVFGAQDEMHENAGTLAQIVADLGGQALERARLYEREQESRRGLDRILSVAPRFFEGSEAMVSGAICREARVVFGADVAMLWQVDGDRLELSAFDPALEPLTPALEASLADFSLLGGAVGKLQVSFVPDVQDEARGAGHERVERLGLRSSLRVPIVVSGEAEMILILSWQTVISEPDASTLVLVRRFADQAGLAVEQLARRQAQAEASRRTVEALRLQELTAALMHAATPNDVGIICLEHALAAVGADAGFVVRSGEKNATLDVIASLGFPDEELGAWSALSLDMDLPAARAITVGAPVWALTVEAMSAFTAVRGFHDAGWAALPLRTSSRVLGAVQLVFRTETEANEQAMARLESVIAQCSLALERSTLLDSEHRLRRRSERLQTITAALSNALTRADVAEVLIESVVGAIKAEGAAVVLVDDGTHLHELLGWHGYADAVAERWLEAPLDADTPQGRALRRLAPEHDETDPGQKGSFGPVATGHASFVFVPLVLGRRPIALLVASSAKPLGIDALDRDFLGALAGQAAQALDRARRFETEQAIAETLQQSVLPTTLPDLAGAQLAGRYLPGTRALEVGGDWYDAILLANGRLGLVVGDVVGKGVRAAATMGQLRNAIRAFSLDRFKPASMLGRLSRLADEVIETTFATVVYAELDLETGVCRYSSAGHPPPIVASLDGRIEFLEQGRGLPLGTGMSPTYRQGVVELEQGSVVVLYSDGLIERRGRSLDEGLERLRDAVDDGPRDPELLVEHILERLLEADRGDDVVVLVTRLLPVAPRPLGLRLGGGEGSLRHVREALRTWLEGAPISPMDAHDVVLATWEACANAAVHSGGAEAGYRLSAELDDGVVRVVVDDSGSWLPPVEPTDRGFGLRLMRSLMSSVEIVPGPEGTRVTLEKQLLPVADRPFTEAR